MFEIHTREVPARRLMSMQRRLHGHQTAAFVKEAKAAFAAPTWATLSRPAPSA